MFGNAAEHIRADFHIIMERPCIGRGFIGMHQLNMGRTFAISRFGRPADTKECAIYFSCLRTGPVAQRARAREMLNSMVGDDLARSIRSARTRRAKARTERTASCFVLPYTITPGRLGISAIHRPSASRSISIRKW
jgi:hypothetical protein